MPFDWQLLACRSILLDYIKFAFHLLSASLFLIITIHYCYFRKYSHIHVLLIPNMRSTVDWLKIWKEISTLLSLRHQDSRGTKAEVSNGITHELDRELWRIKEQQGKHFRTYCRREWNAIRIHSSIGLLPLYWEKMKNLSLRSLLLTTIPSTQK